MLSKRHLVFNFALILLPWLSVFFLDKRNIKRYSLASFIIVVIEVLNQFVGQKRKWWLFYDKPRSFASDVLPFSIGPYMPMAMWVLKLTYGNFKKFLLLNAVANGMFAFPFVQLLKKVKIANLHKLNRFQFFLYLFYKAFILYGVQYYIENPKRTKGIIEKNII
ncbi:hypothetical protein GMD78_20030 [Ornithinibacillus sp. L9]|uniref:Uncharacterized protein n=1 Tax=Ornithinibacillus caprae TaxID=2678566 RepID=A0A6N8FQL5_9BACI|nr:hypothetical protein [Ornithinibacillus caprae]MUK90647.1 hypothetical protein [Ornithinibacillus caprae]